MKKTFRKAANLLSSFVVSITMLFLGLQSPPVSVQAQAQDGINRDRNAETGKATLIRGADNKPISELGSSAVNFPQVEAPGVVWYVSTTGNDTNDCITPATPCATINTSIGKAVSGDTIYVATGTYTGSGTEVVLINKSVGLSGGWDADFTAQIGYSTIDGGGVRRGVSISGSTVSLDHFTIQNGYTGGVASYDSTLTIANSIITNNVTLSIGGGISNVNGNLTLNDTLVSSNQAGNGCCGGGGGGGIYLHNSGTITLNRSAVINNRLLGGSRGSGIDANGGTVILNNSTVSGNTGGDGTGIHLYFATGIFNSSTINNNEEKGVIVVFHSTLNMQNTILALNGTSGDCYNDPVYPGTVTSLGYNLIGNGDGCTITATSGDKIGTSASPIDPRISLYPIEKGGFHLLLSGSPAINAANPANCPATDQRGVSRPQGAGCDIGAYEYGAVPGPAAFFGIYSGSNQSAYIGRLFPKPLAVYVIDSQGNPVNGVDVVFTVPSSGASGVFANINMNAPEPVKSEYARLFAKTYSSMAIYETTVQTVDGIATIPIRANSQSGSYTVHASIPALAPLVSFSLTNLPISIQPDFLRNGNFEDPIQGNYWNAYSSNYGTPFCTLAKCGNGGGTAGPRSGNTWVWFGGTPTYGEFGYIAQYSIIIPAGPARLRFYLWIGYAESGSTSNDKLTLTFSHEVDEFVIFTADATQKNLYPGYKLVEIDLSPYADGSSHYMKFEAQTNGKVVNFNLDDISFNAATFGDVPPDYWSWNWIERLYNAGITSGCTSAPVTYCPDNTVTRAQMAVFLLKSMHGSSYTPPAVDASTGFTDVAIDYWAAAWIKQLAAEGITGGCGNGIYCPDTTVTRAQMAIFLLKAKHGSSYTPPAAIGVFTDVPVGYWADKWIEQLAVEGVTSGCGAGIYCPDSSVTRAQMAVFLVKAFNLP